MICQWQVNKRILMSTLLMINIIKDRLHGSLAVRMKFSFNLILLSKCSCAQEGMQSMIQSSDVAGKRAPRRWWARCFSCSFFPKMQCHNHSVQHIPLPRFHSSQGIFINKRCQRLKIQVANKTFWHLQHECELVWYCWTWSRSRAKRRGTHLFSGSCLKLRFQHYDLWMGVNRHPSIHVFLLCR